MLSLFFSGPLPLEAGETIRQSVPWCDSHHHQEVMWLFTLTACHWCPVASVSQGLPADVLILPVQGETCGEGLLAGEGSVLSTVTATGGVAKHGQVTSKCLHWLLSD